MRGDLVSGEYAYRINNDYLGLSIPLISTMRVSYRLNLDDTKLGVSTSVYIRRTRGIPRVRKGSVITRRPPLILEAN